MSVRDDLASAVASQFDLFASNANGAFWRALIKSNSGMQVSPAMLANDVRAGGAQFMAGAMTMLNLYAFNNATDDAELTDAMIELTNDLSERITAVINSVTQQVLTAWQGRQVRDAFNIVGMPAIEFRQMDSIGRSYNARYAVETAVREFAVNAYLTEQLIKLKRDGVKTVKATFPDGSQNDSVVLKLSDVHNWRHAYFHPNSDAMVIAND